MSSDENPLIDWLHERVHVFFLFYIHVGIDSDSKNNSIVSQLVSAQLQWFQPGLIAYTIRSIEIETRVLARNSKKYECQNDTKQTKKHSVMACLELSLSLSLAYSIPSFFPVSLLLRLEIDFEFDVYVFLILYWLLAHSTALLFLLVFC